jgi:hypothetical protein
MGCYYLVVVREKSLTSETWDDNGARGDVEDLVVAMYGSQRPC